MPEEKNTNGYTHQLSISQLNEWSDMGKVYKEELTKLFGATLVVTCLALSDHFHLETKASVVELLSTQTRTQIYWTATI